MLSRSKLKIIKSWAFKALINDEIIYEDFTAIINEQINYRELKKTIKMMKSQKHKIERNKIIEGGKLKSIAKKITENVNPKVSKLVNMLLLKFVKENSWVFDLVNILLSFTVLISI